MQDAQHDLKAKRQALVARGAQLLGIACPPSLTLHALIKQIGGAAVAPEHKSFAVLLVHALSVPGLVTAEASRGQFDRDLCGLLERALPTVLRRHGYPFDGDHYAKRRSLERLHSTIDELMRPFEPTFPQWQGLYAG